MADWLGGRSGDRFFYRRVVWPTWEEAEEYGNATGGSVELSALSDTKASGSLDFYGDAPPASDLLRVYYTFFDDRGESETVPVATMLVSCVTPTYREDSILGSVTSGSATLDSVLKILKDKEYGMPFTVAAGTQAIQLAVELVESVGLRVNNPDPSAYEVKEDYTFPANEANYLAIVDWLLTSAGYQACWPDEYGIVQMTEYVEPTERPTMMEFAGDEKSVMLPEVPRTNDWQSAKNVCRLLYETDSESIRAWTSNVDPDHPASLPNRGWRESTMYESVSELAGDTTDDRLANLMEMSRKKLVDNSASVEHVEIGCPYLPLLPNMAVSVKYAGLDWKGAVVNFSIDLGDDTQCKVKARRFVRAAMKTETEGEVLWRDEPE